jgi:predicted transcriptional regulator
MPRKKITDGSLTPLELELMNVLWETGPANVQTVQARLTSRDLAYTTVQTMLNILHRKGRVQRRLQDRAFLYQPVLSRQNAMTQAVADMLDRFFGGSADRLVLNLVASRKLTPEKLAELQKLVDADPPSADAPAEANHGDH